MPRPVEEPKIEPIPEGNSRGPGYTETHPSYAMVSFSRTQGGHDNYFGSSIPHSECITIRVHAAEKNRNLNHDWYFAKEELIEVAVTHAQLAEALFTMNGSGTPATLMSIERQLVPACPEQTTNQEVINEFDEQVKKFGENLQKVSSDITQLANAPGTIKKVDARDAAKALEMVCMDLISNLPYLSEAFQEATDAMVHDAKKDIEATQQRIIGELGVEKLQEVLTQNREMKAIDAKLKSEGFEDVE